MAAHEDESGLIPHRLTQTFPPTQLSRSGTNLDWQNQKRAVHWRDSRETTNFVNDYS